MEINLQGVLKRDYLSTRDLYQALINTVVSQSGSDIGYFHLYYASREEIELSVWSDSVIGQCATAHETHYPLKDAGIWADCIRTKSPAVHNHYQTHCQQANVLPEGHITLTNHLSVPVKENDTVVAVLGIGNKPTSYQNNEADSLALQLNQQWPQLKAKIDSIEQRAHQLSEQFSGREPEQVLLNMLGAISRALELRDEYTSQHQKSVAYLSEAIANKLQLPDHQTFGLKVGALVHDIGKISIPAEILNKPSKLLKPEYELLKTHADSGAAIFTGIDFPWPVQTMIHQHHERMDGNGYPNGIKGNDICLEARIIAVADTFDAMASDRPYRKKIGAKAAIEILKKGRGKQYDTYVVDAFLACYQADPSFNCRYQIDE